MWSFNQRKTSEGGFTIPELLVVISAIMLMSAVALAAITKARDKALVVRVSTDSAELKKAVEMYRTQNGVEPCHSHDMSDTAEKDWSDGIVKSWPATPFRTKYFITHTGDPDSPDSRFDYYYIGLVMDPKYAQLFDDLYDDGNLTTGQFRSQATPVAHYSITLFLVPTAGHTHTCL